MNSNKERLAAFTDAIAAIAATIMVLEQSSFGKFFKRHTGEAPRAFRERK